ncbi:ABC transporter substrate-binding protein [Cronbergia sp. UHCC 0137]|uniref:ABC transporter substrate-binding protein n=1 Tax=Cronbergia sp. UHCC 0137 TaxID=3110239 RepID=UPI002B20BF1D|nr:ABC transporter substrate-binding protein [Cronbergia sp. UHCC 0137]MEA5621112.1 ABC transporter substrate-binding protein [Cronbergia sp. UHCC 0137]
MKSIFFCCQITNYFRLFLGILLSFSLLFLSGCESNLHKDSNVIHLTLWQSINPPTNRDVFQRLVKKFNQKYSDIQVDSVYAEGLPKILTAVVGNSPPDILSFYPQLTGQFVELGAIVPLEQWFDQLAVKSEVIPNAMEELKLDGHLWSIPLYTSNIAIFYRPKLFEAGGIKELPKSWEELRQVAKKLTIDKNGDGRLDQHGILLPLGKKEWTVFSWFPFLLSAGGEIVTNGYPNLTNPGAITALKFWESLIKDGSAILSAPERGYEEDDFVAGRVAMQITGPWTYITRSKVDYNLFSIPTKLKKATVIGGGNLYVMKTNPAREKAALRFLEFVMSEEFQTEWSVGTGFLPVNINSAKSPTYQEYLRSKPWLKVFIEQMSVARPRPVIAGYNRLSNSLDRAIESTLMGKSSAELALKEAQERLELIWNTESRKTPPVSKAKL